MINKIKKISRDVKAFTLTEVMIGMMILTVAIVSASNLLTGIIDSNRNNLTTLQAYYLSQEGLEMVRNIRDTNWLHNRDWLGSGADIWGGKFEADKEYVVEMVDAAGSKSDTSKDPLNIAVQGLTSRVSGASPWKIKVANASDVGTLYLHGKGSNENSPYIDSISSGAATDANFNFKRKIIISKYSCDELKTKSNIPCPTDKVAYVLVQSKVEWTIGAKKRELVLSEVLTNWKGGAL